MSVVDGDDPELRHTRFRSLGDEEAFLAIKAFVGRYHGLEFCFKVGSATLSGCLSGCNSKDFLRYRSSDRSLWRLVIDTENGVMVSEGGHCLRSSFLSCLVNARPNFSVQKDEKVSATRSRRKLAPWNGRQVSSHFSSPITIQRGTQD